MKAFVHRHRHRLAGTVVLLMLAATVLWHLLPGHPLLGMAGVPLAPYLTVSILAELLIALGYLTAGRSFATGQWGLLLLGAAVVIAALLIASMLRERARSSKSAD